MRTCERTAMHCKIHSIALNAYVSRLLNKFAFNYCIGLVTAGSVCACVGVRLRAKVNAGPDFFFCAI